MIINWQWTFFQMILGFFYQTVPILSVFFIKFISFMLRSMNVKKSTLKINSIRLQHICAFIVCRHLNDLINFSRYVFGQIYDKIK